MPSRTYDNLLLLKDAGAVVADAAAQVGGSARVVDVGNAHMDGVAVIDTSAIDFADTTETYTVRIQGSQAVGFGTFVELGAREIKTVGRIEIPFNNEINGVYYQYIRAYNDTGGATPSINSTVFIAKP
jgi:hypothetical protein